MYVHFISREKIREKLTFLCVNADFGLYTWVNLLIEYFIIYITVIYIHIKRTLMFRLLVRGRRGMNLY